MKSYPSIPTIGMHSINNQVKLPFDLSKQDWIGFDKLDGSLIRVKWSTSKGLHDFGRKNGLLDHSNPSLLEAPEIIEREYHFLNTVFREYGWMRAVVFFEFLGPNSFAGVHEEEKHSVHIIDISVHKKGFIEPKELTYLDAVGGAQVVHRGPVTKELLKDISQGAHKGVTFEGVVFKRNTKKGVRQMFKSKSEAWYRKLKDRCGRDEKLFRKLK